MKATRRLAVLPAISIIGIILPQPATATAASARAGTVEAFVARVYRPYMRTPVPTGNEPAWFDRGILSRDFLRLVRADQKLAGGEEGYIDADPICACQDWGHFSYTILHIRHIDTRRFVTVRLHNWSDVHMMTLVLLPDGHDGFVIDDLRDDVYRPSFKVWMAEALRDGPEK